MTFVDWVVTELDITSAELARTRLVPAFEVLLSRVEEARRRGARDPFVTVSAKRAGGNSRACTRRMLAQLGYTDAQRRAMHRLLAGSPSGWPGLLALYCYEVEMSAHQRHYARRQLSTIGTVRVTGQPSTDRQGGDEAVQARGA